MKTLVLSTAINLIIPLFVAFALFMFFRGHDLPGGGFIAGLIASIPFMVHAMACGYESTIRTYRLKPRLVAVCGLITACFSGMLGVFAGKPFMTALWIEEKAPLIGKIGTPILFDLGVFLIVWGVVLQITFLLSQE